MASRVVLAFFFVLIVAVVTATPVEEKPLDCPANEQYYKCALEVCQKTCDHLKTPPPCPSLHPDCYEPACVCKYGYLRNAEGVCVPIDQCA